LSAPTVSTRLAQIAEQSCGQQRVMRLGWERPRSLALRRVLTNRMREYFTYGSVGGAGGNPGSYPAPNDEERGQPHVPFRASSARSSSSVSFAFGGERTPGSLNKATEGTEPESILCFLSFLLLNWQLEKYGADNADYTDAFFIRVYPCHPWLQFRAQ